MERASRALADPVEAVTAPSTNGTRAKARRDERSTAALRTVLPGVDGVALRALQSAATSRTIAGGEILFRAGDPADAAYIVVSGRLDAVDGDRLLGHIGPGGLVGESALVLDRPRNATIVARRDTELIELPRAAFASAVRHQPDALVEVVRTIVTRAESGRGDEVALRGDHGRFIALVGGTPSVDISAFAHVLADGLRVHGSVVRVDADTVGERGEAADGSRPAAQLRAHLDTLEAEHDTILLVADPARPTWTERCLRQADRIVVVGDVRDEVPAQPPAATDGATHRTLVLLHAPDTDGPRGTAAWIDACAVDDHHHVRRDVSADIRRLARVLVGREVVLVLGGGGARGFAHLGVYRILREEGVPVDRVAGTSMGSIVGSLIASDQDPDRTLATVRDGFRRLRDYTLPVVSLLRGRRIWDNIRREADGRDIVDLWLPFVCMSTDLTRSCSLAHRRGDLATALRASVAVPGVLPPVAIDGSVVVDGGVLDNLPIAEVRRDAPDATVIAVDVVGARGRAEVDHLDPVVSGWRLLLRRIAGRAAVRTPGMLRTLLRSTVVSSARARDEAVAAGLADCYLDLDLRGCGLLDFDAVEEVAERGHREADTPLRRWLATADVPRDPADERPSVAPRPLPARASAVAEETGTARLTFSDLRYRSTRFAVAIAGTALVFTLLLMMTGISAGFRQEPLDTVQATGATTWIVPRGVSGPFTSASTIDPEALRSAIATTGGVPAVVARHSVQAEEPLDVVIIGLPLGSVRDVAVSGGRAPERSGEALIDVSAGHQVGGTLPIGDRTYQVVGTTRDTTILAGMPIVWMSLHDARALLYRGAPLASTVLVQGDVSAPDPALRALSADAVADDATRPLERAILTIDIVRFLLWIVAAGIIGAVTYLVTLERERDLAVLRAIGASSRSLVVGTASQALVVAVAASLLAIALALLLRPVFPMRVLLTGTELVRLPLAAAAVAALAGTAAILRTVRADPATAFAARGA